MSEFWKRKMRTYFSKFDLNDDRVMSKDDWVGMSIRFAKIENEDKKTDHLRTQFVNVWEQFVKHAETGDKEVMTAETFTNMMEKMRYDPDLMKPFTGLITGLFNLMDVNCDGYLQDDEYARMLAQSGVHDTMFVKEAFKAIDVNGDGKLSIEEFVNAFFDFMFSEDEKSPNTHYFGPLVARALV